MQEKSPLRGIDHLADFIDPAYNADLPAWDAWPVRTVFGAGDLNFFHRMSVGTLSVGQAVERIENYAHSHPSGEEHLQNRQGPDQGS